MSDGTTGAVTSPRKGVVDVGARLAIAVLVPAVTVLIGLLIGALAILVAGASPLEAYAELIRGALGSPTAVAATLVRSVPIVVAGVGLAIAFRAGCFNLGAEGQMIAGALAAAATATALPAVPAPLLVTIVIGAALLAGGGWAVITAWLDVRWEVPLLITTLLLNYVAALLAAYVVSYPLRDPAAGSGMAQTAMIPSAAQLPELFGVGRLHVGVLAIVALPVLAWWLLSRTSAGYEMRMTGLNRRFGEYGGVRVARQVMTTMFISGAICGLAGALLVMGVHYRYVDATITTPGYAWTGFTAALLAAAAPVWTLASGLFLAGLEVGSAAMERTTDIPIQIVDVVQASIIGVVAVRLTLGRWLVRRLGETP